MNSYKIKNKPELLQEFIIKCFELGYSINVKHYVYLQTTECILIDPEQDVRHCDERIYNECHEDYKEITMEGFLVL